MKELNQNDIKKHNIVERRIKSDIIKKNILRKKLEREIRMIRKWQELKNNTKNNRRKRQYQKNLERYLAQIPGDKQKINEMINDLEKRIKDEMEYSETEVAELQKMYKKEHLEMINAEKLLEKTKKGELNDSELKDIVETSKVSLSEKNVDKKSVSGKDKKVFLKEFLLLKAKKIFKKEKSDVKDVTKELDSESSDKILFQNELNRMMIEKEILK